MQNNFVSIRNKVMLTGCQMTDSSLQTPLLFFFFDRPEHTQKVFDINRSFRPSRLFVAADGHSLYVSNDAGKFAAARMVVKQVDWNSDVRLSIRWKEYANEVCGTWNHQIVLFLCWKRNYSENDCLPDPSLYSFSTTLLEIQNRFRCYANQQE